MKDGYYLATYLHFDPICHLLNMVQRHDHNIALFHKSKNEVRLVRYWELERVTGIKQHDLSFYDKDQVMSVICQLLEPLELTPEDMVEIWGTPHIQTHTDYHSVDIYPNIAYHNVCHLFSSLLSDTRTFYESDILALAVDTAPDNVVTPIWGNSIYYYAGCFSRKGNIEMVPIESPGIWWGLAAGHFQKREGTLMALAYASESRLLVPFRQSQEFSTQDRRSYGKFVKHNVLQELDEHIERCLATGIGVGFTGWDDRFTEQENKISMAMKEIQRITISIMQTTIDKLIERFGIDPTQTYLSLSGGYALNCPTNSWLMKHYKFKGFIAPPCVNDSGISLGMGLFAFYRKFAAEKFHFQLRDAFYGNRCDVSPIEVAALPQYKDFIGEISSFEAEQVVEDILEMPVAWFQGEGEMGPRALGHRSILGDPSDVRTKEIINNWKRREWWRPIAPIVMEEYANGWFEDTFPTPYMLHTFRARQKRQSDIQAALHLDQTARVQTIGPDHALLYRVLQSFFEKTGIPVICNSSLNDKGEPIIDRLEEAINFCLRKGVKVLYFNENRIVFTNHHLFAQTTPEQRPFNADPFTEAEKKQLLEEHNPHHLPIEILQFWKYTLEYEKDTVYDITKLQDAEQIMKAGRIFNSISSYKKGMTDFMNMHDVNK